jgi:thiol-disulfide isomerase/thioredoxin
MNRMNKRTLVAGGIALAAALAGGTLAWRQRQSGSAAAIPGPAFWDLSLDTPSGPPLAMQSLKGRPLLINFWATWCPPCIEEMPLLDRFYRENKSKSWQVLGIAIDKPAAVKLFLSQNPISYPVGVAGLEGTELLGVLGNVAGGLPYTVVIGPSGEILQRKMGLLESAELRLWVAAG